MKRKSGQILILILLIVVVALAVGLSVASRNITNLRTSTQAEHSQRALSAAEGGVEDVLSRLTDVANYIKTGAPVSGCTGSGQANCTVPVGNIDANVVVKASDKYESTIEPGEIGQVDLKNVTAPDGSKIQVEWVKIPTEESDPASIEVTLVKNVSGTYTQDRKAWSGNGVNSTNGNEVNFDPNSNCSPTPDEYKKCASMDIDTNAVLLRIKPFWARTTVRVTCSSGCILPTQTYEVVSEAQTEIGVTRKIQVTRTALPQLPAAFDYVLYSESAITK